MRVSRSAWCIRGAIFPLLVGSLSPVAHAGSVLVPNAGVEVFRSWAALTEGFYSVEHAGSSRIIREGGVSSLSYGVTGTLLLGLDATVTRLDGQENKTTVEPDIRMKWNFWSKLSPGHYHRLAVQANLGVPLGDPSSYILDHNYTGPGGSNLRFIKPRIIPTVDLVYSRATSRFVYGADLGYSVPTADHSGIRIGDLKKASLDGEYAFWRGEKAEMSFVAGAMVRHFGQAHGGGATFADTGGSDVALSSGIQYAPMPTITFEASFTSDVWSVMRPGQPRMGNGVLFGIRFLR
jgi:hypothetical protein